MKTHILYRDEATLNSKDSEIKPIALSYTCLKSSDSQIGSRSLEKSAKKEFLTFHSSLMQRIIIDLKIFGLGYA